MRPPRTLVGVVLAEAEKSRRGGRLILLDAPGDYRERPIGQRSLQVLDLMPGRIGRGQPELLHRMPADEHHGRVQALHARRLGPLEALTALSRTGVRIGIGRP